MPTVGDLLSIRCPLSNAICVRSCAIPAHDLYTRMFSEPFCYGGRFPVWQEVHWHACFQIYQDRAIGLAFTEKEIIQTQYSGGEHLGVRLGSDKPQEGIWAAD